MKKILLCLVLLPFFSPCSAKPHALRVKPAKQISSSNCVYVVNHGWHTGFIFLAKEIDNELPFLRRRFNDTHYYEIGWGEKKFYQAKKITTSLTLQTLFWPSESVIHVVALPSDPLLYFSKSEIIRVCLDDDGFNSLKHFISSSFKRNTNRQVIPLQKGVYAQSQFYSARGKYHLLNTCNTWTAKGVQSAGVDINPALKLTAESVMSVLRKQIHPCE